jgi:tetratricopeptide (TPR) repeat protein
MPARNQVFLSYAHEDLERVQDLYRGLKDRGLNVWFDKQNLNVGRWKTQIERAIAQSRYFIICLSEAAIRKTGSDPGFQDEELNRAYNIALEQAGGDFAIIPVRLEECGRGDHRMSGFQQFDLFEDWNGTLDRLSVLLGGKPLGAQGVTDTRSQFDKSREEFQSRAIASYYAGDFERALDLLKSIAVLFGDDSELWFWEGLTLNELRRYEEALNAFKNALSVKANSKSILTNIGVVLTNLRSYKDAIEYFDQVTEIDSQYALASYNKALALKELGNYGEAKDCLHQLWAIDSTYMERHKAEWGTFYGLLTVYLRDHDDDALLGNPPIPV